ncbi:hypothetical protein BVC71_05010 [Marivivens niveibacter]|uniref:Nickel transporter n=1 Tax=Marivivens niveibacter TaxID=1930667 RepID=A0A251X363_9RHOB|nr:DUF4198 domain-containing protein [Marivivens niveibacter]OUD10835.1 hypothetical protein BVC71_05010 [Marivivens niveibacter]
MRSLLSILALVASPVMAHELWLEPLDYIVPNDGRLVANIVNGEAFDGANLVYLPSRIARFENYSGTEVAAIEMRAGDRPGLDVEPVSDGLNVVIYQSTAARLTYTDLAKFQRFVDHKSLPEPTTAPYPTTLPDNGILETYWRYSKTLVGVGDAVGIDQPTGLLTEFVALSNPYSDDTADFKATLLYEGEPRARAQVEVFEKSPTDEVTIFTVPTTDEGVVTINVKAGYEYMLDAVVLRAPELDDAVEMGAMYETHWANLTFAVPE